MLFVCIAVLSEINAIVTLVHEKVLLMYLPTTGLCPLLASHVSYPTVLMALLLQWTTDLFTSRLFCTRTDDLFLC